MRKFFGEFKKFITRGNVIDLAVAVIIAGAFTAIITAVTSKILTPCIDWGAFVSAVIDFILISFFLFVIVKVINKSNELLGKTSKKILRGIPNWDERKMLKAEGINLKDREAVKLWLDNKHKAEVEKAAQEKAIAEANKPENILKEIRDLLRAQKNKETSTNSSK